MEIQKRSLTLGERLKSKVKHRKSMCTFFSVMHFSLLFFPCCLFEVAFLDDFHAIRSQRGVSHYLVTCESQQQHQRWYLPLCPGCFLHVRVSDLEKFCNICSCRMENLCQAWKSQLTTCFLFPNSVFSLNFFETK